MPRAGANILLVASAEKDLTTKISIIDIKGYELGMIALKIESIRATDS